MRPAITFQEYLDAAKPNTADIIDALIFLASCNHIFNNSTTLQAITSGKNKDFTATDLNEITKAALSHSVSIAKQSFNSTLDQKIAVSTEIQIIIGAVAYLNSVRLQNVQDSVANLSEIHAIRRYSQGEVE